MLDWTLINVADTQAVWAMDQVLGVGRVGQKDCPKPISNGLGVSIAVRLKRRSQSVSSCPFQMQNAMFHTDELRPPANECPPLTRLLVNGVN